MISFIFSPERICAHLELKETKNITNSTKLKIYVPQEAGTFGKSIEKEPQKPRPKLKKICILYIYREYLLCLQSNASGSFL